MISSVQRRRPGSVLAGVISHSKWGVSQNWTWTAGSTPDSRPPHVGTYGRAYSVLPASSSFSLTGSASLSFDIPSEESSARCRSRLSVSPSPVALLQALLCRPDLSELLWVDPLQVLCCPSLLWCCSLGNIHPHLSGREIHFKIWCSPLNWKRHWL